MNRIFLVVCLLCDARLCASGSDQQWLADEIVGYRFELVSDSDLVVLAFTGDGYVQASVGKKDDGVWPPLWRWKIDEGGLLRIRDYHGKEWMVLRKIRIDGERYFVDDAGAAREYVRTEWDGYWDHHKKERTKPNKTVENNSVRAQGNPGGPLSS